MSIVFEEIDTEIAPEPPSAAPPREPESAQPHPAALADSVRRELALIDARRMRLIAD